MSVSYVWPHGEYAEELGDEWGLDHPQGSLHSAPRGRTDGGHVRVLTVPPLTANPPVGPFLLCPLALGFSQAPSQPGGGMCPHPGQRATGDRSLKVLASGPS